MRRYDHKYATTDVRANDFIATLNDDWRVLRIGRELVAPVSNHLLRR